jgi:pimeloyl-ACP methyl ester carboxylesterase
MTLPFEVSGTGEIPLLCVHGWGCTGAQFAGLADRLGDNYRIYRPDLPGHGQNPLGDFHPTFADYAAAVCEFSAQHELADPVLIGHSMGGALALIAAASGKIRPRAIINLDGSLPAAAHVLTAQATIRGWLDEPDFRERLAAALSEGFFLPQERDSRCVEIVRTMCAAPGEVLRFLPEQIDRLDASAILPGITVPTLYIGASRPRFDGGRAAAAIARLRIEQIPDAGHFLHIYAVSQVQSLVEDFLHPLVSTGRN